MNARVFLLVLFSFFFMSVWNADQKAAQRALARKATITRRAPQLALRGVEVRTDSPILFLHSGGFAAIEPALEGPVSDEEEVPLPTPAVADGTAVDTMPIGINGTLMIVTSVPFLTTIVEHDALHAEVAEVTQVTEVAEQEAVREEQLDQTVSESATNDVSESEPVVIEAPEDLRIVTEMPVAPPADEAAMETQTPPEASESLVSAEAAAGTEVASTEPVSTEPVSTETADTETAGTEVVSPEAVSAEPVEIAAESAGETAAENVESSELPTVNQIAALPLEDVNSTIPLPKNLASGTWQVMGKSGEFFRMTIHRSSTGTEPGQQPEKLEESFCISTSPNGDRWCFVRSFTDSAEQSGRVSTRFFAPAARP